jgi:hypothetical protein
MKKVLPLISVLFLLLIRTYVHAGNSVAVQLRAIVEPIAFLSVMEGDLDLSHESHVTVSNDGTMYVIGSRLVWRTNIPAAKVTVGSNAPPRSLQVLAYNVIGQGKAAGWIFTEDGARLVSGINSGTGGCAIQYRLAHSGAFAATVVYTISAD